MRRTAAAVAAVVATAVGAQQDTGLGRARRVAEQELTAGNAAAAETALESAGAGVHDATVEIALVRTYMQRGEYRRALAFAAHAAGEHGDYAAAGALYAWLLHAGGQQRVASRLLDSAFAAAPADAVLLAVRERLASPSPTATGALLVPPARFAPYATGAAAEGRTVASAVLIDGGRRALASVAVGGLLWLRNGIGGTARASVERRFEVAGAALTLLRLETPLPSPENVAVAERVPFAGSVGVAVEYAATPARSEAAWPWLRLGFFGRAPSATALPALGIDMPPGPRGGPVFDDAGRLVGLALRTVDMRDLLVPAAMLPDELRALLGVPSPGGPTPRAPLDLTYERSLLLALQVIAADATR